MKVTVLNTDTLTFVQVMGVASAYKAISTKEYPTSINKAHTTFTVEFADNDEGQSFAAACSVLGVETIKQA